MQNISSMIFYGVTAADVAVVVALAVAVTAVVALAADIAAVVALAADVALRGRF